MIMSLPELNAKQTAVLDFVQYQIEHQGYPPSVREIGSALGISSSSTVHGYLRQLESLGYLHRDPAKPRAMVIAQKHMSAEIPSSQSQNLSPEFNMPLIDYESLLKADFDLGLFVPTNFCSFWEDILPSTQAYVFIMPDDSMIKIGIFPGDYLLIDPKAPTNGDIVLACVQNALTVKTYFKGIRQIRLQPENDWYEPLYLTESDYQHIGKVCANIRRF